MVSSLKGKMYEERLAELEMETLSERRHQLDMVQTLKIVRGLDSVDSETWFTHVNPVGSVTRAVSDPLNLVKKRCKLDLRSNFFSQRVVDAWNAILGEIKRLRTAYAFKKAYKKYRLSLLSQS